LNRVKEGSDELVGDYWGFLREPCAIGDVKAGGGGDRLDRPTLCSAHENWLSRNRRAQIKSKKKKKEKQEKKKKKKKKHEKTKSQKKTQEKKKELRERGPGSQHRSFPCHGRATKWTRSR